MLDKSIDYKNLTDKITKWLKENYVGARGKDCYDNLEEQERIFGERYLKKKANSQL